MKNVEHTFLTTIALTIKCLVLVLLMMVSFTAKADIIDLTADVDGGYKAGSTSTILIHVMFNSNTIENGDIIEFRLSGPIAGLTLSHGFPSPSPFTGCGGNRGDKTVISGPSWVTPGFPLGGSSCGAFESNEMLTFGINVNSDGMYTGSFGIEVRIVGDGQGEAQASQAIEEVTVLPITCMIMCPDPITLTAPNTACETMVNVPSPVLSGDCSSTPPPVSGIFPVGETVVLYEAQDGNGNDISCTTLVTIVDDEDPFVAGVSNLTYDLSDGECSVIIPQTFAVTENCINPARVITQNEHFENFIGSVNCIGGPTKYLRVFDTVDEDIDTELNIEEVTFGVFESFGNPFVTVNIYRLDGPFVYANMELIGTGSDILPNFENALYSIPVTATLVAGEIFVVEIIVPGSLYNGVIVAMNQGAESAPSYLASDFCGHPEPRTMSSLGFPVHSTIMIVEGYETSYVVRPVGNSPLIGDEAQVGVTQVEYEAIDASGNSTSINFTVTVNGFEDYISAIACNDEVQVSLGEDCTEIIGADVILEGGPYACYDEYTVQIEDSNGNFYGNMVTGANIGQDLIVRVTGPNGNSCWGKLIIQDKQPPLLECIDVVTTCYGETFPGSPISERVTFPAIVHAGNENINPGPPTSIPYTIPVSGLIDASITHLAVRVNIEHTRVSDLTATIEGPDGTTATLFIQPGTACPESDLQITLDDNAFNTAVNLSNGCTTMSPAISGIFQPAQFLSVFNGKDPNGNWTLTISDVSAGEGGKVIAAELVISQTGGVVTFPTTEDILYQTEGNNMFTVLGLDACGPATLAYNDLEFEQDCSSPYSKIIQRSWSATDESGNQSIGCVQFIYIMRNGLATLMFPPNYDGIQAPYLSCEDFGDQVPPLSVTGGPSGDLCDNVQIFPFTDTRIDICDKSYKLVRHFQLLEWCSGEVVEHNQIIKVLDDEGPIVEQVDDVTISAGEFDCTADYFAIPPTVISDCSDEFTYNLAYLVAYDGGQPPVDAVYFDTNISITPSGNFLIQDLPFDRIWARWKVKDECGNFTYVYFTITVNDQVNPIAVCDEFTVVSVGGDGFVKVNANTFDDGSLDNCGILHFKARKMVDICSNNTTFGDQVTFCCQEVGQSIMVAFQVTDISGNKNTCMVEVKVQDKLPPYITKCPKDVTIDCQGNYEDLTLTGEPEYIDNCEVVSIKYVDDPNLNNCGVGTVRRVWTVEDKQGLKGSCVQIITLEDDDPFVENDIIWPRDYEATTCNTNLEPDNLPLINGYPRYSDDNCSLVGTVYEDKVFTFVDGACEKILREWTVIDWCTYNDVNPVLGQGLYKHLQVIKLRNTNAPDFVNCLDNTQLIFGACEGNVTYTIEAEDDCTPSDKIVYSYQIDLYGDGLDFLDTNLKGNSATFSRVLPIGVHTVYWTAEDKCGNPTHCEMELTVKDGKKPTPYCLSSITTVVMNSNGSIAIWANDFDYGSYDNCTPKEDLIFSFSQNINETSKVFTCDNLPNGVEEVIQLELWVTDAAGNQEFCSISLILQDSQEDVCDGENGLMVGINGSLRTEKFDMVEGVMVTAYSPVLEVSKQGMTNNQGEYFVTNLPKGGGYRVKALKNDDIRNGVSTLDLVLIQRHILGLKELDGPYQLIAADINNDEQIKSSDLLTMRKVILGISNEFPNDQKSWRFVPKGINFQDPTDPFPFVEEINIGTLEYSSNGNDLTAIKIGDINGNAVTNLYTTAISQSRNGRIMTFEIENAAVESGERVYIPFTASGIEALVGYQLTMGISGAEYAGIESGLLQVGDENIGVHKNELTISWSDVSGAKVRKDEVLFTLILDVEEDMNLSELLQINSNITTAEAYDMNDNVYDVALNVRAGDVDNDRFAVFQNKPNPFMESTNISFYLPEASKVELIITDVTGRQLTRIVNQYNAGKQNVEIKYSDLGVSGVLYYTIKAGEYTATKKMISVR